MVGGGNKEGDDVQAHNGRDLTSGDTNGWTAEVRFLGSVDLIYSNDLNKQS